MNKKTLKSDSFRMAANMARGTCLGKLSRRCDGQKTIATSVVEEYLEGIQESLCDYSHQMTKLIREIPEDGPEADMQSAINYFCAKNDWAASAWKEQDHIDCIFKLRSDK